MRQHVGALRGERVRRFAFTTRIEPRVHPDDLDLRLRIDAAHAARERVDAHDDFGNRKRGDVAGEPPLAVFKNRVFAIGGASDSPYGAMRSLMALRQVLELGCGALVLPEQITVFRASEAFDEMDDLKEERAAATLKRVAQRLVDAAREMA